MTEVPPDVREWIEVKESTGKGLGVFATTDIPCGARVLAEEPLLRRDEENGSSIDILSAFEKLSVSQKNSYLQLRGFAGAAFKRAAEDETGRAWQAMSPMERKILAIWAANTFGHVFLLGSRFNHSCIPNINFAYNPDLDKETFHAVRNITAGEELTITYIDGMNRTRKQRQVELDKRGFICDCPACENTKEGETREKKRAQMLDLDQALAIQMRLRTSAAWSQATRLTQRLAAIQRSEGLLTRPLGITYHDTATVCIMLEKMDMALLWAEKELELDRICVGDDHPHIQEERNAIEKLKEAIRDSTPVDPSVTQWFNPEASADSDCTIM